MVNKNHDAKGRFTKGNCANPNGRPRVSKDKELLDAIAKVEKEKGKPLVEHFVERAYVSDSVLAVIYKKILPDKKAVESTIFDDRREQAVKDEQKAIDDAIKTAQALESASDAMAV